MKQSLSYKIFGFLNIVFLIVVALLMLIPYVNMAAKSFSSSNAINLGKVVLYPVDITLKNYYIVFHDARIVNSFLVTIFITVIGTLVNMIFTVLLVYPLSRKEYLFRKAVLLGILFTFVFQAPLIPVFLWVKTLGMYNSLWALIIPNAIAAYYVFILKSFFDEFPQEIIESARIDGSSEIRTLVQIVLPLSKAALATIALFYAVGNWNTYYQALVFLRDNNLMPLQVRLYNLVMEGQMDMQSGIIDDAANTSPEGIKAATVFAATIPIIIVYPFLQKYFVSGIRLGAIKG